MTRKVVQTVFISDCVRYKDYMEEILKPRSGQNIGMLCIHAHKLFIVYYTIRNQSVECIAGNSGRALDFIYIPGPAGRHILRQVVHTHVLHVPLSLNSII